MQLIELQAPKIILSVISTFDFIETYRIMSHMWAPTQDVSPFPAGDYRAARNSQDTMTTINMKHKKITY